MTKEIMMRIVNIDISTYMIFICLREKTRKFIIMFSVHIISNSVNNIIRMLFNSQVTQKPKARQCFITNKLVSLSCKDDMSLIVCFLSRQTIYIVTTGYG